MTRLPSMLLLGALALSWLAPDRPSARADDCCSVSAATCSGASPCNACRSCKSCKHCKGGGTCGACK